MTLLTSDRIPDEGGPLDAPLVALVHSQWGGCGIESEVLDAALWKVGRLLINAWSPEIDRLFLAWLDDPKCDCESCAELRQLIEIITDVDPVGRVNAIKTCDCKACTTGRTNTACSVERGESSADERCGHPVSHEDRP